MNEEDRSGRHPVSVGHLVMGVAFIGILATWALYEGGVVAAQELRWLLPVPWLAAGLAGIGAMTLGSRRPRGPRPGPAAPDRQPQPWPTPASAEQTQTTDPDDPQEQR